MKVNTDSILLGAVAHIRDCKQILDLGTGSGLIAIMLAQRTAENCYITGVELEPNAYLQAVINARNSAWAKRIYIKLGDVMQQTFERRFDLVVSNPPYFDNNLASKTEERGLARSVTIYTHLDWLKQAKDWLSENGRITMILPCETAEKLISQSHQIGLYCIEKWRIVTKVGKTAKRMIVSVCLQEECEHKELVIYNEHNRYTAEFKQLTQDFYLNF